MIEFDVDKLDFSLGETLSCGQCFRWKPIEENKYIGVVNKKQICITQSDGKLFFDGVTQKDCDDWFIEYLGLDEDYSAYKRILSQDNTMKLAITYAQGIRIMKQPFWETLCSFIISQNNNIPRITGIIDRLCECFGENCDGFYSFPEAEVLAEKASDDLAPLRSGFRARYIIDAAQKVARGEIDEAIIRNAPIDEARSVLMKIKGVGPKVADCTMLFGAGRYEAFPVDVWMKKAMTQLFPCGLPEFAKPIAGIAQQYIFHYARTSGEVE
ncbi:MAG: DNA glycosylase [Oscillospiraceae bacterium]